MTLGQGLERGDGLRQRHRLTGLAGELLHHVERLGEELLDAARPADVLGQLVDAEDRDDVLQVLVALQDALHLAGHPVVLLADVAGVEDAAGRVQRVDGRVDAQLGDGPAEHRGGVGVGERGVRRGVGDVVRGDVDACSAVIE
jgi:hypothetical protein